MINMKEETYKIIGILIFGIGFFIVFASIFLFSMQDTGANINISSEYIQFDAFIYDKVYFDKINKIEYLDDFEIHGGKHGAGFSNNGYFSGDADFKGIGQCRAYVYYKKNDFIVLHEDDKTIIFNTADEQQTKEMYDKISEKINIVR